MKKFIWSLSIIVSILGLASCGGGSSKEAKELLQKILQFKGIPQTILANICQDSNRDGTCGVGELFTKVTINKGDSLDDIWRKISLTDDGKYFLQTYNPELPILVELQDIDKVTYDDGKFTLTFNGFKTKEDDNETKEISILESMVDANALSKTVADKFRTLNNPEAQDKYYTALLDSLERNINTLREKSLDSKTAVKATIKEMADETRDNQEQADRINSCENNQTCIDSEIKNIKDELIITEDEANSITTNSSNSSEENSTNNSSTSEGGWIVPNGVMKDTIHDKMMGGNHKGETIPEFIDLKEMSVDVTDTNIIVTMTMVNLPNKLVYNRDTRDNNDSYFFEYTWGVDFKIDNNHTVDLLAAIIGHNSSEGEKIGVVSDIIILYFGHSPYHGDGINITINGNSIIFNVSKSINKDLNRVTSSTKVKFHTFHAYNGNRDDTYDDSYPKF